MKYTLIKKYKDDDVLRKSFNELAIETFGIDFEPWYQKGCWNESYIPYSFTHNNKVIANASANLMNLRLANVNLKGIQIGTVSTKSDYQKQGLAKKLLIEIENDYDDEADFYYLFGNDSAVAFYEKCGYQKIIEKNYHFDMNRVKMEALNDNDKRNVRKLDLDNVEDHKLLQLYIKNREYQSNGFGVKNDSALLNFYFMFVYGDCIYLDIDQQIVVVVSSENNEMTLHDVLHHKTIMIDSIIDLVCQIYLEFINVTNESVDIKLKELKCVDIDFKPVVGDESLIKVSEKNEEDSTTFIKLKRKIDLSDIRFPGLSHA